MKLKNSALQELYDTVVNSTITISPYEASPIDKAFKECDEKLSESITFAVLKDLQDRNDILERSNKALLEANMESISKTRKLEKDLDYAKNQLDYCRHSRDTWRDRAKHAEKEVEGLKKQNEDLASQYQKLTIENKRLQEVSDYYYFGGDDEFDTDDCETTSMRDWLHDFCANRFCEGCPLASNEYKCGRGYSFTGAKPIPDEDIKRYYEKARACSKPLSHWECTLEGTIEIDKDLLKKVCGIDSDD